MKSPLELDASVTPRMRLQASIEAAMSALDALPPRMAAHVLAQKEVSTFAVDLLGYTAADLDALSPDELTRALAEMSIAATLFTKLAWPEKQEAPRAPVQSTKRWVFNWTMLLMSLLTVTAVAVPLAKRGLAEKNLAEGKPWRASSTYAICHPERIDCGGRTAIFFHTLEEDEPWVEFDLQAPTQFSKIVVHNRRDGPAFIAERAVPLVIEVGDDQKTWKEIARRDETFMEWTAKFEPVTARYLRLRTPHKTYLHLESVKVYR
jgi:hypothetical protein